MWIRRTQLSRLWDGPLHPRPQVNACKWGNSSGGAALTTPEVATTIIVRPYGDPWWDNAVTQFQYLLESVQGVTVSLDAGSLTITISEWERFHKSFSRRIRQIRDSVVFVKIADKEGVPRFIRKPHILLPYGRKTKGRNVLKARLLNDESTDEYLTEVFEGLVGEDNRCVVCSRRFGRGVEALKQGTYPFVTKIKSLSGVRTHQSLTEYYKPTQVCPICSMIGVLEWTDAAILFIGGLEKGGPRQHAIALLPIISDLGQLAEFKADYRERVLISGSLSSNLGISIDEKPRHPRGPWSLLLLFYERLFHEFAREISSDKDILKKSQRWCREWLSIRIPEKSPVKNVKVSRLPVSNWPIQVILQLTDNQSKKILLYTHFLENLFARNLKSGKTDWDYSKEKIREEVAQAFLTDNLHAFAEALSVRRQHCVLFGKDALNALDPLLLLWRCKKMSLDQKDLASIKSAGNLIAEIAQNHTGALYKLERVRNVDELWSSLREISRRMISLDFKTAKVNPTSLDAVVQLVQEHRERWEEVRDLLVIYSCVYYAVKTAKRGGKSE